MALHLPIVLLEAFIPGSVPALTLSVRCSPSLPVVPSHSWTCWLYKRPRKRRLSVDQDMITTLTTYCQYIITSSSIPGITIPPPPHTLLPKSPTESHHLQVFAVSSFFKDDSISWSAARQPQHANIVEQVKSRPR